MKCLGRRRGVASVIGTMFFVMVFMVAMGFYAYQQGLQAQAISASQQAQQLVSRRAEELLSYALPSGSLSVVNSAPQTSEFVSAVLKYPNGTVYSTGSGSWSALAPFYQPPGTSTALSGVVPPGTCGGSSCLSKYTNVAAGSAPKGSMVGLVTSLGNTFWYNPSSSLVSWSQVSGFPSGCTSGQYVTGIGSTVTCSQVGWSQLAGFPSPCASNQYVSAYGATLVCSSISLPWTQLTSFPSGCAVNQYVSGVGASLTCSQVGWTQLTGYPSGCTASQYVMAVGATVTCSQVGYNQLSGSSFPAGCSAGYFVTGIGLSLTCSQVGWSQLTSYPSGCASNQFVSAVGSTLSCSQVGWSQLSGFPGGCPAGQFVTQIGASLACGSAGGSLASYDTSVVWTSGKGTYSSTGLSVQLQPNHVYGFYAFTAIEPEFGTENYNFEVHPLPSGASLVIACAPMSYPQGGGNQPTNCVTSPGTPIAAYGSLGFGVSPPVFQTPGVFGLVSVGGTGGTLEIDFACIANCGAVSMNAGSFMVAIQVA